METNEVIAELSKKVIKLEKENNYLKDWYSARIEGLLLNGVFKDIFEHFFGENKFQLVSTEYVDNRDLCFIVGLRDNTPNRIVPLRELFRNMSPRQVYDKESIKSVFDPVKTYDKDYRKRIHPQHIK